MKFIHLSDLHLQKFYKENFNRELSIKINEDIWKNFSSIINYANEQNIPIMLIAGDVFEREYFTYTDMNRLLNLFNNYLGRIFISLGNHDYYTNSLWEKFTIPKNIHIFSNELSYVDLDEFSLRIFGISYDRDYFEKTLKEPEIRSNYKNILVVHAEINNSKFLKIDKDYIKKFDYVALGHIHKRQMVLENAYYPGSIEPLSFKETGEHGFLVIDTDDFKVSFKRSSIKEFKVIKIGVNEEDSLEKILKKIDSTISSKDDLYRFVLNGKYKNIDYLINYLKNNINDIYFEIVNELLYPIDIEDIYNENKDSLISDFIDKMSLHDTNNKFNRDLNKRALELGLKYLLEAKDGN